MTTVACGLEVLIHKIEYLRIGSFPSLTIIVDKYPPQTLVGYSREAKDGDVWIEEKAFQMRFVVDAFETCVSWPISFELVSPVETTALGKVTFEVKPLICDAIACHGSSPVVVQSATLRDFERREVAILSFEMRVIFFRMTMKRPGNETSTPRDLPQAAINRMRGVNGTMKDTETENYPKYEMIRTSSSDNGIPRMHNISTGEYWPQNTHVRNGTQHEIPTAKVYHVRQSQKI